MTLLTELYALTTAAASHEIPLVPLVAIVNLFVNIIAGNMPLLIPAMMSAYQYMPNHLFEFYAAPVTPVNDPQAAMVPILYTVTEQGAIPLKYSMITVLCGLYGLSGILFLVLGMRLRSHAATKLPST